MDNKAVDPQGVDLEVGTHMGILEGVEGSNPVGGMGIQLGEQRVGIPDMA